MEEVAPGSRLQVLAELRDETGPDVIRIGTMLAEALQHWPDSSTLEVVITRERRLHYLARHSEVVDDEPLLIEAVLNPSEIHVNKLDGRIAIVYEALSDGFYLRIPVWVSNREDRQNSVLSLRRARAKEVEAGRAAGRQVWRTKR